VNIYTVMADYAVVWWHGLIYFFPQVCHLYVYCGKSVISVYFIAGLHLRILSRVFLELVLLVMLNYLSFLLLFIAVDLCYLDSVHAIRM